MMSTNPPKSGTYRKLWFPAVVAGTLTVNSMFLIIPSCGNPDRETESKIEIPEKEELIKHQSDIVSFETADIENYIKRMGYEMQLTGTGLRYQILDEGTGKDSVKTGDEVSLDYKVLLLDGTLLYSSDSSGYFSFRVDKSDAASGLHEGVKYMKEGGKAVFIMPSHLAYGLTGDGGRISHYKVLVVEAHLSKVIKSVQ